MDFRQQPHTLSLSPHHALKVSARVCIHPSVHTVTCQSSTAAYFVALRETQQLG